MDIKPCTVCGSYALNDYRESGLCDVCHRDAEIQDLTVALSAETKRREEAEDLCRRLRESLDNTAEEHDTLRADNARLREIVARYMTASGDVAALDADAAELLGPGGVTAAIAPKGKGNAS